MFELIIFKKLVLVCIVFDCKDFLLCLDQIVFLDFGVYVDLLMGEEYVVEIMFEQVGEYGFFCGMNMMYGKMIVEQENDMIEIVKVSFENGV